MMLNLYIDSAAYFQITLSVLIPTKSNWCLVSPEQTTAQSTDDNMSLDPRTRYGGELLKVGVVKAQTTYLLLVIVATMVRLSYIDLSPTNRQSEPMMHKRRLPQPCCGCMLVHPHSQCCTPRLRPPARILVPLAGSSFKLCPQERSTP
jgi:hypothetical protein